MHVQRVILLVPAVLGLLATGLAVLGVLPWVTPSFSIPRELLDKSFPEGLFKWTIRADLISLACFTMAAVMSVTGGFAKPISLLGRLVVFVNSLLPLVAGFIILANYSTTVVGWMDFGGRDAEWLWPGFGTWLMMASALVLLISSIVVGRFGRGPSGSGAKPAAAKSEGEPK